MLRIKRKYLERMKLFAVTVFETRIYRRNIKRIYVRAAFDYLKFNAAANRFALKIRLKTDSSMSFNRQTMRRECFDRWRRRTDCILKLLAVDDIAQMSYIRVAFDRWKRLAVPHLIAKFKAAKGIRLQDPKGDELLKFFGGEHAPERLRQMKQQFTEQAKLVYSDVTGRVTTAATSGSKYTAEALGLREPSTKNGTRTVSVSPARASRHNHAAADTELVRKRRMKGAMKQNVSAVR